MFVASDTIAVALRNVRISLEAFGAVLKHLGGREPAKGSQRKGRWKARGSG